MTSTTTTTTTTTTGTGGSGGGSTAGHMFSDATPIMVNDQMATGGVLTVQPTSTDFYTFMGTAGEHVGIATTAKTGTDPFDTTYLDLAVVTVYDSTQTQIAQQDDPWPRLSNDPQLFIELPTAGQYYIEVEECNAAFPMGCADPSTITNKDYTLQVFDFGAAPGTNAVTDEKAETAAAHADDTTATSNAIVYLEDTTAMPPEYFFSFVYGTYFDGTDVDVYSFTPKSDSVTGGTRANAEFWLQTSGTSGNGSTTPMGLTWVVDSSMNIISQLDGTNYGDVDNSMNGPAEFVALVTIGQPYFLFVQHPATAAGANDFYIFQHAVQGVNPVEAETANMLTNSNDTIATAEALTVQANADGSTSYFIEGDLPAGDLHDIFKVTAVTGFTTVTASCAAQRLGSGMQGMTYKLLGGATGTTAVGTAVTENATSDQFIGGTMGASIPAGTTTLYLQIDPGTQSPTITSNFYRCGMQLSLGRALGADPARARVVGVLQRTWVPRASWRSQPSRHRSPRLRSSCRFPTGAHVRARSGAASLRRRRRAPSRRERAIAPGQRAQIDGRVACHDGARRDVADDAGFRGDLRAVADAHVVGEARLAADAHAVADLDRAREPRLRGDDRARADDRRCGRRARARRSFAPRLDDRSGVSVPAASADSRSAPTSASSFDHDALAELRRARARRRATRPAEARFGPTTAPAPTSSARADTARACRRRRRSARCASPGRCARRRGSAAPGPIDRRQRRRRRRARSTWAR